MKKRSFFFKEYLTHFILIVVAFTLAGSVFYHQMASYALRAKQTELKTTVQSLAEQSKLMQGTDSDVIRELYMLSIARIAKEDELTVLVTNESGEVQMAAHPNGSTYSVSGYRVPAEVVSEVTRSGSYAAVGSVGVLTEATSYTVGSCVRDTDGNVAALIFVSCEDPATAGVVRHSTQTLVLILLVTLAAMLIISFILSQHITRPIKNIAAAAKEFASGNFDVRVPEDNHCYEIDELAVSFNNMARDLDQLEELTRGFISNVSHEFKTPMTTIGGFVDGMIDGTIPEEQRDKYLRIIAEETRRLSRMVNRMLDAAKIQSGELLLSPAPFDFSAMTSQIILSFEQKIEKKKLEVECELDDRLIVMGDRDHLYRAVYNLVDNAVKFIDEGNLYRLIAGSRLPSAERFESWIFDELVPRTLKEGGYLLGKKGETDAELLSRALMLAENKLKERDRRISELKKENALNALRLGLQAPKIRYFDEVLRSSSTYTPTQIAKELGMSGRELNLRLKALGIQFRQSGTWMLTARYQKEGYTRTHTHSWQSRSGETGTAMHTVWTEKGRLFIHCLFSSQPLS